MVCDQFNAHQSRISRTESLNRIVEKEITNLRQRRYLPADITLWKSGDHRFSKTFSTKKTSKLLRTDRIKELIIGKEIISTNVRRI